MPTYELTLSGPRPYFAEIPYYLWGCTDYYTEGDCGRPADQNWKWLEVTHRVTSERLCVNQRDYAAWTVEGPDPIAARTAHFLVDRCAAVALGVDPADQLGPWDADAARARATAVQAVFERSELQPFNIGHFFWGSWKWIGCYSSQESRAGRWIMDSLLRQDRRAVGLCAQWLRQGPSAEAKCKALCSALSQLTGEPHASNDQWIAWYFDGPGMAEFPEPGYAAWQQELQQIHAEVDACIAMPV